MGLFDKFRKKVREAASDVDTDSLSAEEGSEEAMEALSQQQENDLQNTTTIPQNTPSESDEEFEDEDDWEDFDDEEKSFIAIE